MSDGDGAGNGLVHKLDAAWEHAIRPLAGIRALMRVTNSGMHCYLYVVDENFEYAFQLKQKMCEISYAIERDFPHTFFVTQPQSLEVYEQSKKTYCVDPLTRPNTSSGNVCILYERDQRGKTVNLNLDELKAGEDLA